MTISRWLACSAGGRGEVGFKAAGMANLKWLQRLGTRPLQPSYFFYHLLGYRLQLLRTDQRRRDVR